MPTILARFLLFLSSYFPLAVVLFVLLVREQPIWATAILFAGLLGLVGLWYYLHSLQETAPQRVTVAGVQRRDREVIGYLLGYVVPYLAVPFSEVERGIGMIIFLGVVAFLFIRANMIHINTMLMLVGYRLYDVTLENGGVHALITKDRVVRRGELRVMKIGDDILYDAGGAQ